MGFFISTMMSLLINLICCLLFNRFAQFNRCAPFKRFKRFERPERLERLLCLIPRWPFFGLDQASVSAVAIGMILRSPAAADGDGCRLVKFQNVRRDISDGVRAVAERRVFRACAAAISYAL